MAEIRVRNLEQWVVQTYRTRARRNGRSLAAELRQLLRDEAVRPKLEQADELAALRNELLQKHGRLTDSAVAVVQQRGAGE